MSHLRYRQSYRRNLPHIQPPGATLFVTFRLAGSLPISVVTQWKRERLWLEHLAKVNPLHYHRVKLDFERAWFTKFEQLLDSVSCGPAWLRNDRVAAAVAESLRYRDGKVYRLDAFSVMPNHVHTLFKPLPITTPHVVMANDIVETEYHSLAKIMQSLKGYTASKNNRLLKREGEFWAHESYDHYVRNEEEWRRIVRYILNNPVKAGLARHWSDWNWNYRRR